MDKQPGQRGGSVLGRLRDKVVFFLHFLRHPRRLGVPTFSSPAIAETVRRELAAHGARRVVELGAGMGALTGAILEALPPEAELLCVEREPAFCGKLRNLFDGRVRVVQADALDLPRVLAGTQWERPDAIVCSVPLIGDSGMQVCATIAQVLPDGALYLQVANFRASIEAHFGIRKTYRFLANIPPEKLHVAIAGPARSAPPGRSTSAP